MVSEVIGKSKLPIFAYAYFKVMKISPALVVAIIALFFALGGTSYAISQIPRNSVGTEQLRANSVTGAKVKNGSLTARDFKAGSLPRGPQGPQGEPGPPGPAGGATSGAPTVIALSYDGIGARTRSVLPDGWVNPTVTNTMTGVYRVDFGRSVAACSPVTSGGMDGDRLSSAAAAWTLNSEPNVIYVETFKMDGTGADRPWRLMLACPN